MMKDGPTPERLLDWLENQREAMIGLLEKLVNIDSGSYNHDGVNRVCDVIEGHLRSAGVKTERIRESGSADCVIGWVGDKQPRENQVLLMGHCDTVFPDGTAAKRPFGIRGDRAYGPGVADMKAGLVMNTFLIEAFGTFSVSDIPLVALYTADEEIGSPYSRTVIREAARGARAVFNAEPGRPDWSVVTARKGSTFFTIRTEGRAAHSGANPQDGVSAIEEMSRKIQALHALNDFEKGTTVNVGLVSGGDAVNMVAPWAQAEVDLRFKTREDREKIWQDILKVVQTPFVTGTNSTITGERGHPPLAQSDESRALFDLYREASSRFGLDASGVETGGAADSGFTAELGAPTLCAVGPIGGSIHRDDEYLIVDTLVSRTRVLAETILSLDGGRN